MLPKVRLIKALLPSCTYLAWKTREVIAGLKSPNTRFYQLKLYRKWYVCEHTKQGLTADHVVNFYYSTYSEERSEFSSN